MANENSIIGIKVNGKNLPAKGIMIIRKYKNMSISEIKQIVESDQYMMTCDYIDNHGIKLILKIYKELKSEGINCSLFEHNNPTSPEFLRNLSGSYTEIEKEVEEEMELEAEDE